MSKKTKRKFDLKSAILILLLLAALLTASTYAWFTANKVVTVSDIDVHIEAQNGLQISANGTDWKSILTLDDLLAGYTGDTNQIPDNLEPVSTIGEVADGKLNMFYGSVTSDAGGNYTLTATDLTGTEKKENGNTATGKFVAFDIFLKVNNDQPNIILGENSTVTFNADKKIGVEGLQNAARVAFLKEGISPADADASTYQAQKGALSLGETDDGALGADGATGNANAAKTTTFWEPNADSHNATAVRVGTNYGLTLTQTSPAKMTYWGLKQAIATGNAVNLKTAMTGKDSTNFSSVTTTATPTAMTDTANIFSLAQGVTKVRVYMWVEGQDIDCEDTVSGSDITFKLEFKLPDA